MDVAGVAFAAPVSLEELVLRYGGTLDAGAAARRVRGIATVDVATSDWLAPFTSRRRTRAAVATAAVLLVAVELAPLVAEGARWVHPHAAHALARMLEDVEREVTTLPTWPAGPGLVHPGARLDPSARIGPGAVVFEGAEIGPDVWIEPNAVIYPRVRIGARVHIGAGAVIGRPGFGFVASPAGTLVRVPQLGGVRIEDDAEIGPLATVDAGTLGPTVVGRGAKLDAHVHVGHNGVVGPGTIVAAQAGLAGSVTLGAQVRVGGQAGFADHVTVGDGAQIAAKAGVIGDVPAGAVVAGYPAVDRLRWLRATARSLRADDTTRPTRRQR